MLAKEAPRQAGKDLDMVGYHGVVHDAAGFLQHDEQKPDKGQNGKRQGPRPRPAPGRQRRARQEGEPAGPVLRRDAGGRAGAGAQVHPARPALPPRDPARHRHAGGRRQGPAECAQLRQRPGHHADHAVRREARRQRGAVHRLGQRQERRIQHPAQPLARRQIEPHRRRVHHAGDGERHQGRRGAHLGPDGRAAPVARHALRPTTRARARPSTRSATAAQTPP